MSLCSGLARRVSVILAGNANTVFTVWVLGMNPDQYFFFALLGPGRHIVSLIRAMVEDLYNHAAVLDLVPFAATLAGCPASLRKFSSKENHHSEWHQRECVDRSVWMAKDRHLGTT